MRTLAVILGLSLMACTNTPQDAKDSADSASLGKQNVEKQETGSFIDITIAELKKQMDTREEGSYIILDVRTPAEIARGKISGALEINFYENFSEAAENLDQKKEIFVYCAAGGRSTKASEMLAKKDFPKVYNILDGFGAWSSSGFPIENKTSSRLQPI